MFTLIQSQLVTGLAATVRNLEKCRCKQQARKRPAISCLLCHCDNSCITNGTLGIQMSLHVNRLITVSLYLMVVSYKNGQLGFWKSVTVNDMLLTVSLKLRSIIFRGLSL